MMLSAGVTIKYKQQKHNNRTLHVLWMHFATYLHNGCLVWRKRTAQDFAFLCPVGVAIVVMDGDLSPLGSETHIFNACSL